MMWTDYLPGVTPCPGLDVPAAGDGGGRVGTESNAAGGASSVVHESSSSLMEVES